MGGPGASADEVSRLVIEQHETAGIDGRHWDTTYPGAMTVDAVHRSVLLRFPSAPHEIATRLDAGFAIEHAEVVLEYDSYEIVPVGYVSRGFAQKEWAANAPRWHLVAWALRRPWIADATLGPTFNAYIGGAGYWTRYGASDTANDRYPVRFGPAELSQANRTARLDVTALLVDPAFGNDVLQRLKDIGENGLLIRKLETYDHRYRDDNAAEWAVPTGGNGLKFGSARLVVSLANQDNAARRAPAQLSAAVDVAALAELLKAGHGGGTPTAVVHSLGDATMTARAASIVESSRAVGWRRQRMEELLEVGGDGASAWEKTIAQRDNTRYAALVRDILAVPPRFWKGWWVHDDFLVWHLYRDLLPECVQDHIRNDWIAWLMPDIATKEFFHPQSQEAIDYWKRTGDWRGRASFFRDGYNYGISTQNFNHTAAMGALLGGDIIQSPYAIEDGRYGLENLPLRLWSFNDGSTQEMLDHYYLSITLSDQKMIADYAPSAMDRLMGRVILDRSMELLSTAYHPNLRRMVSPSGRTNLQQVLIEQDGIYAALHTMSQRGTLKYLDRPFGATVHGMRVWGYNTPPGRIGMQALVSSWASPWLTNVIDEKTFPFEETAAETIRGTFKPPFWRRMYLGRYYGLASQDLKGGVIDMIAQWSPKLEASTSIEDLGTLTVRYAVNRTDMAATHAGTIDPAGGTAIFQHRNRAIVLMKPLSDRSRLTAMAGEDGLTRLASVIALWNFRPSPEWQLYVDGKRVTQFPAHLRAGQLITLEDGVTYLGIVPLPATNLGRRDEVVIGFDGEGASETTGAVIRPSLTITSYNFQSDQPVAFDKLDWPRITTGSFGGFVIELGDASEYGDFDTFSRWMRANRVQATWNEQAHLLEVQYRSGNDLLEVGFDPSYSQAQAYYPVTPGEQTKALPYRRINGAWPYLPPGIERDTSIAQQGTTGRLEKNGAMLETEKGHKGYLLTEPVSGTFTGYNPLPDPTTWSLSVPGEVRIEALGKVSLLKVAVQPSANRLWIDYAAKPGQAGPEMATRLRVTGMQGPPVVQVNGKFRVTASATDSDGKTAYLVPLTE
jgi:hypothetical protein